MTYFSVVYLEYVHCNTDYSLNLYLNINISQNISLHNIFIMRLFFVKDFKLGYDIVFPHVILF